MTLRSRQHDTRRHTAGARRRARFGWVGAGLLVALAIPSGSAFARSRDVAVTVDDDHGVYSVRGAFDAAVSERVAWQVLTDYDHIGSFVTSVRASSSERRPTGRLVVTQTAEGGLFAIKRRVQVALDIQEEPRYRIFFADVLGRDFRCYVGDWFVSAPGGVNLPANPFIFDAGAVAAPAAAAETLAAPRDEPSAGAPSTRSIDGVGTVEVRYMLQAQPRAALPGFLGRAVLRREAERLLAQVRAEMLRRAAAR